VAEGELTCGSTVTGTTTSSGRIIETTIPSASCTASSEHPPGSQFACENAFDANTGTEWATQGEGAGSWIQSEFGATYRLTRFEYRHRNSNEDNRQITLSFSDGSSQTFTLQDNVRGNQAFAVTPVQTTFVRITLDTVYEVINNGGQITFTGLQGKLSLPTAPQLVKPSPLQCCAAVVGCS